MKIRKLSVYEDSTNKPYILLKGKWLQKLGFNFHNFVEVETFVIGGNLCHSCESNYGQNHGK